SSAATRGSAGRAGSPSAPPPAGRRRRSAPARASRSGSAGPSVPPSTLYPTHRDLEDPSPLGALLGGGEGGPAAAGQRPVQQRLEGAAVAGGDDGLVVGLDQDPRVALIAD